MLRDFATLQVQTRDFAGFHVGRHSESPTSIGSVTPPFDYDTGNDERVTALAPIAAYILDRIGSVVPFAARLRARAESAEWL